jgi:uncharacterized membrane protein
MSGNTVHLPLTKVLFAYDEYRNCESERQSMDCCELEYYTWAYLNEECVPVLCSRKKANKWYRSEDEARAHIKRDTINGWCIDTRFLRFSVVPDGLPGSGW